jgi:pimeloyl-ACP methyl ester carboxylesterase
MEWVVAVVALVLAVPVAMYVGQDRLLFHPQPVPENARAQIEQSFPGAASVFIQARDGTRLHAWHLKGSPLVVYFGGNGEDVSWMLRRVAQQAPGAGWVLVDYRGYGFSAGSPSEAALSSDAIEWFDYAKQKLEAPQVVLFGRSLGSGVAVQLAAARAVEGVILATPYDSMTNVASHHYPYLPVSWMLKHPFDSLARAPSITAPLLCLVAEHDQVIPVVHSKQLFEAWKGPKRWVELAGAGHNSTDDVPAFGQAIREFLVQPH